MAKQYIDHSPDEKAQARRPVDDILSGNPIEHYHPSGRKYSKKELTYRLAYAEAKEWSLHRQRQLNPLPLPEGIERRIRQWFELVDDDHSGQLDASELESALRASGIPANANAILEIIKLFDFDKDGEIAWNEFHNFLSYEVMADKNPLGAEYVLPSGMSLPISSMIGAIRRRKLMNEVERGGTARDHWVAEGPEFLRFLIESEEYDFELSEGPDLLARILSYKPPSSIEADPEALEAYRRRMAKLRALLQRAADGATHGHRAFAAAAAAAAGNTSQRLRERRRQGSDTGSVKSNRSGSGGGVVGAGRSRRGTSETGDRAASPLGRSRLSSETGSIRGDCSGQDSEAASREHPRVLSKSQVRFAQLRAAAEAAAAEEAAGGTSSEPGSGSQGASSRELAPAVSLQHMLGGSRSGSPLQDSAGGASGRERSSSGLVSGFGSTFLTCLPSTRSRGGEPSSAAVTPRRSLGREASVLSSVGARSDAEDADDEDEAGSASEGDVGTDGEREALGVGQPEPETQAEADPVAAAATGLHFAQVARVEEALAAHHAKTGTPRPSPPAGAVCLSHNRSLCSPRGPAAATYTSIPTPGITRMVLAASGAGGGASPRRSASTAEDPHSYRDGNLDASATSKSDHDRAATAGDTTQAPHADLRGVPAAVRPATDTAADGPRPSVPRLALHLVQRSNSSGPGPYSARLAHSGRELRQLHGAASARAALGGWQPGGEADGAGHAHGHAHQAAHPWHATLSHLEDWAHGARGCLSPAIAQPGHPDPAAPPPPALQHHSLHASLNGRAAAAVTAADIRRHVWQAPRPASMHARANSPSPIPPPEGSPLRPRSPAEALAACSRQQTFSSQRGCTQSGELPGRHLPATVAASVARHSSATPDPSRPGTAATTAVSTSSHCPPRLLSAGGFGTSLRARDPQLQGASAYRPRGSTVPGPQPDSAAQAAPPERLGRAQWGAGPVSAPMHPAAWPVPYEAGAAADAGVGSSSFSTGDSRLARRSLECDMPTGWRAASPCPGGGAPAAPPRECSGSPLRGRLMRSCLAASLRSSTGGLPGPPGGGGACGMDYGVAATGSGALRPHPHAERLAASREGGHAAAASAAQQPVSGVAGGGSRRKLGLLFGGQVAPRGEAGGPGGGAAAPTAVGGGSTAAPAPAAAAPCLHGKPAAGSPFLASASAMRRCKTATQCGGQAAGVRTSVGAASMEGLGRAGPGTGAGAAAGAGAGPRGGGSAGAAPASAGPGRPSGSWPWMEY